MKLRTYRTFQALVLAGLGIFFLARLVDGKILLYINQRFIFLILLGAVGFLWIAQVVMRARPLESDDVEQSTGEHNEDDHQHEHAHAEGNGRSGFALWIIALPLLIGVLIPARPLGTFEIATRGINTSAPLSVRGDVESEAIEIPSTQRNVLDWIRAFNYADNPAEFEGQLADVTGFVYQDIRLEAQQFMVGRFSLTCCVADAVALGLVVDWPEAASLENNRWVRVRGPIAVLELDGKTVPLVRAEQVESIPSPEQPYLFP